MAIRQKTTVTQTMTSNSPSHSRSDISIRDVDFVIDEPVERGGSNQGPSPTETAIAALIGCTNVISNKCADKLGIDIGHMDIEAKYDFDRRGAMLSEEIDVPFPKISLTIKTSGPATDEELARVATELNKFCPISKVLRQAGTVIEEEWISAAS